MGIFLDVSRTTAVYLHIISMIVAAVSIALLDYIVFKDETRLHSSHAVHRLATTVLLSLVGLWISGLAIIGIDTGFDLQHIFQSGKLLAKLIVVTALTINGIAVHFYVIPRLANPSTRASPFNLLTITIGVLSTVSWGYAAFLGIARALTAHLGFGGFISLYLLALAGGWLFAVIVVRPKLLETAPRSSQKMGANDEVSFPTLQ
jgi:hypothetical protein